jgi:ribosomal protein L11 methyltransferase
VDRTFAELAFTVDAADAEAWSERLVAAGAAGVEERDPTTLAPAPDGRVTLVVWVAPDEVEGFCARAGGRAELRLRDEGEWRDAWKRHFGVRRVGRFVIVPSWERHAAARGEVVLDLDPGRAFGTGAHASTWLCLQLLDETPPAARFADVGCGSGILGIACARAWPEARGAACDIDPDALEVSRENAARNRVDGRIAFSLALPDGGFEVITANIQPEVLIPMAPALAARLQPGGSLILSGILVEAAPAVEQAYGALLRRQRHLDAEGWRALVYTR